MEHLFLECENFWFKHMWVYALNTNVWLDAIDVLPAKPYNAFTIDIHLNESDVCSGLLIESQNRPNNALVKVYKLKWVRNG